MKIEQYFALSTIKKKKCIMIGMLKSKKNCLDYDKLKDWRLSYTPYTGRA